MSDATITARMIAQRLTTVLKRTVSPKQVRGRVRGDSGTPLINRYGEGKAPYASHLYTVAEANAIGESFVKSHNARSGQSVKWPSWGSVTRKAAQTRKPRAKAVTVAQSASQATPQTDASNG